MIVHCFTLSLYTFSIRSIESYSSCIIVPLPMLSTLLPQKVLLLLHILMSSITLHTQTFPITLPCVLMLLCHSSSYHSAFCAVVNTIHNSLTLFPHFTAIALRAHMYSSYRAADNNVHCLFTFLLSWNCFCEANSTWCLVSDFLDSLISHL